MEAEACDRLIEQGKGAGRLFGVPISVKESFNVQGMKTTGGLLHRAEHVEHTDAEVVRKLKKEGAVILGKTNTSTVALTFESTNKLYGQTNNPWDVTKTAGGSSGGEAALIAGGGAAVGVGSDIAGSLRLPAHFNGVITLKGGDRQVSTDGHFPPPTYRLQENMFGVGALCKSVADAELIHAIIAREPPPAADPAQFHLIIPDPHPRHPVSPATKQAIGDVRHFFAETENVMAGYPDYFSKLPLIHLKILTIDGARDVFPLAFPQDRFPLVRTMARELIRKDTEYYYHFLKTMLLGKVGTKLFRTASDRLGPLKRKVAELKESANRLLDQAVMVLPVFPTTAKPHGKLDKTLYSNRFVFPKLMPYTLFPNVLGLPALSVPVAEDDDGMPISIQIISRIGNEQALFHFGRQIEQAFRGYKRARP